MLGVGPPVQAILVALLHDEVEGGAAVGVQGVLVKIARQPFAILLAIRGGAGRRQAQRRCNQGAQGGDGAQFLR